MSNDDTPTTNRIRDLFTYAVAWDGSETNQFNDIRAINRTQFDRWLDSYTAQVRAETAEQIEALADEWETRSRRGDRRPIEPFWAANAVRAALAAPTDTTKEN